MGKSGRSTFSGGDSAAGGGQGGTDEVLQPQWFKVQGLLQMPPLKSTLLAARPHPPVTVAAAAAAAAAAASSPRGGVL